MHRGAPAPLPACQLVTPRRPLQEVRLPSVSNLSAHPPCSATHSIVWPRLLRPLNWSDAVQGVVVEGDVLGPHLFHTAEATGLEPVTPTSTSRLRSLLSSAQLPADCQQITLSRHKNALSAVRFEGLDSPR